ncbi:hypothetical protein AVEN_121603-1 [Araneus ventricosus]|uniref:Uncharacterized protein n=1 Tax=Araneus ventricosus TaxID=182803 RepID=A0A4Y2LXE5_ARAVE|nr:hypothetical protein AVEN_121603-1 [Araneus ventricosus]
MIVNISKHQFADDSGLVVESRIRRIASFRPVSTTDLPCMWTYCTFNMSSSVERRRFSVAWKFEEWGGVVLNHGLKLRCPTTQIKIQIESKLRGIFSLIP